MGTLQGEADSRIRQRLSAAGPEEPSLGRWGQTAAETAAGRALPPKANASRSNPTEQFAVPAAWYDEADLLCKRGCTQIAPTPPSCKYEEKQMGDAPSAHRSVMSLTPGPDPIYRNNETVQFPPRMQRTCPPGYQQGSQISAMHVLLPSSNSSVQLWLFLRQYCQSLTRVLSKTWAPYSITIGLTHMTSRNDTGWKPAVYHQTDSPGVSMKSYLACTRWSSEHPCATL